MRLTLDRALWLSLLFVACGGGGTTMQPTPVKDTPLAGSVDGQPWAASSGTASGSRSFSDAGEKWIDVSSSALTCSTFGQAQLIGVIPWQAGTSYDLSLAKNLTIVVERDGGTPSNKIATSGRVEVISAPATGVGVVRIRARFNDSNTVEGQVSLNVCD